MRHQRFEQFESGVLIVREGGEAASEREQLDPLLAVDTDEGDVLGGEAGHQVPLVDGLTRLSGPEREPVRNRPVVAVVDRPVLAQCDGYAHRCTINLGRHLHTPEHVVARHPQFDDPGADLPCRDAVHPEGVPQSVGGGGDIESVLAGTELEPQDQPGTSGPETEDARGARFRGRAVGHTGEREPPARRRDRQSTGVHDRGVAD